MIKVSPSLPSTKILLVPSGKVTSSLLRPAVDKYVVLVIPSHSNVSLNLVRPKR